MKEYGLEYLEVRKGDFSLILGKKGTVIQKEKVAKTASEEEILEDYKHTVQQLEDIVYIKAPLVGTFYRAPSPESPPFVDVGSQIKKGDTLCIVEAMKVMNEIKSDYDGTIKEILVENGKPVEYGQFLFILQLSSPDGSTVSNGEK
ncbi:MAG: acetyl-CoA carboxylase biotin carboxyl carrier protein [Candidatus Omnitrophica bacterium]|nr:acetyl-CoA carboxylase biotin carboxyl carrier protein [Candidatus Omnitrophota bacterium]